MSRSVNLSCDMPFMEHIAELRIRFLYSFIALGIAFSVIYVLWSDTLLELLLRPVREKGVEVVFLGLGDMFFSKIKIAVIAAGIMASPVIAMQFWKFIMPALEPVTKKTVVIFSILSVGLFLLGISFGYGAVFWVSINFFLSMGMGMVKPMLSLTGYLDFLLGFVVPFGVAFELPVICFALGKVGLIRYEQMVHYKKQIILIIFVLAGLLTPPDVFSQILMAGPLLLLYWLSMWLVRGCCR